MRRLFPLILCAIYLLTSSIFTHVQAMDMLEEDVPPCHALLADTEDRDTTTKNDDCLESCLGYYDAAWACCSEEKRTIVDAYTAHHTIDPLLFLDARVLLAELGSYHPIDGGGYDSCGYLESYIKITKKLE